MAVYKYAKNGLSPMAFSRGYATLHVALLVVNCNWFQLTDPAQQSLTVIPYTQPCFVHGAKKTMFMNISVALLMHNRKIPNCL